jgi:hypothetical protein
LDQFFVLGRLNERDDGRSFLQSLDFMLVDGGIELGLSDFEDDIGLEGLFSRDDFGAFGLIGFVSNGGVDSGSGLDEESAAIFLDDSFDGIGSNRNSFFVLIDFFGDTNGDFFGINTKKVFGRRGQPGIKESAVDHEDGLINVYKVWKDISWI